MSGEGSVEVSVPTDLTVTSDADSDHGHHHSRRQARELQGAVAERAELQRVVERQRVELERVRAELGAAVQGREAAVARAKSAASDQLSARQIQITRLELELRQSKEELGSLRERAARELAQLSHKCALLHTNQKKLTTRQDELRRTLANLQLSEEEYTQLRHTPPQHLSLQQYTALRVYELVWPLRLKLNEAEAVKVSLEGALTAKSADLSSRNQQCLSQQKQVEELQRKVEHYSSQLLSLREEQRSEDFKVRNYSRVKSERDQFEENSRVLSQRNNELELTAATVKKERDVLQESHTELKTRTRKQELELEQYRENYLEVKGRLEKVTEELESMNRQLRQERERNEVLHDKYVGARGDVVSLTQTQADHQHEIRQLRQRVQSLTTQCSGQDERLQLLTQQNETLTVEVERARLRHNSEVQELSTEVRELRLASASGAKNRETLLEENTRLLEEVRSVEAQCREERAQRQQETSSLRQDLQQAKTSLAAYQGLETEYEKNIRAAAALPEDQANQVLDKVLPGIRATAGGGRMAEQCVVLTRRVLQLERQNLEACTTIQQLTEALDHLRTTVASYKSALGMAGRPTGELLERVADLEDRANSLHQALHHASTTSTTLEEENTRLRREMVELKQRLEGLLTQGGELQAIKEQLQAMRLAQQVATPSSGHHIQPTPAPQHTLGPSAVHPSALERGRTVTEGPHTPRAIIITKDVRKKL